MDPAIECNGNKYKLNLAYACKTVLPSRARIVSVCCLHSLSRIHVQNSDFG